MSVEIKSNQITGISTYIEPTDAASKEYADANVVSTGIVAITTADEGEFLFTNGTSTSWEPIQETQEYTTAGSYTFNIPTQAKKFTIEATGAGGGGASGDAIVSQYEIATLWIVRTAGSLSQANTSIYKSSDSTYLLGGELGLLNYSTDSISWTLRTSGSSGSINAFSFYSSDYVAGGSANTIMWTRQIPGFGSSAIFTLMYDGSNYFAAGAGGVLNTSTDSINWVLRTSGRTTQIGYATGGNGLLYASGQTEPYVYAGASGVLASSTDSIAWTIRTTPNSTIAIQALAFGALPTATYVRSNATAGHISTSTNAIQWTLRTTGNTTNIIQALLYSEATTEYYVNCRAAGALQTSTNAIHWTSRTSGTTAALHQLLYGGVYVVSGASGVINTSTNAIEWTLRTSGTTQALYGLAYTSGSYVASGASGVSLYSTDAIVWTLRTSGFGTSIIYSVTYGSNIFVQSGAGGALATSPPSTLSSGGFGAYVSVSTNSISWSLRTTPSGIETINCFAVNESNLIVAGTSDYDNLISNIIASTDSVNWELRTSGLENNIIDALIYDGTNYIAGGTTGGIISSTNSIEWTLRTSGISSVLGLTYGSSEVEKYVACGASGAIISSTNVIEWTLRTSGFGTTTIRSLSYSNSVYVANGDSGKIASSTDAITWVIRTSNRTQNLLTGVGIGITFLTAGASGAVCVSPFPSGAGGSGGGGGASVTWELDKSQITGSTLTINVGSGGTSNTAGAGTTVSWDGPAGTYSITANGGSSGTAYAGGAGGTVPNTTLNYFRATTGSVGAVPTLVVNAAATAATTATLAYQTTGGGGGAFVSNSASFLTSGGAGGTINYYNNTLTDTANYAGYTLYGSNGIPASQVSGLSYGKGGNGGLTQGSVGGSWVARTSGFGGAAPAYTLTYGGGIYVAYAQNSSTAATAATSTNGIVWILRTVPTTESLSTSSKTFYESNRTNQSYFIGGLNTTSGITRATVSTDGITWEMRSTGSPDVVWPTSPYLGGYYFQYDSATSVSVSTNLTTWEIRTTGSHSIYSNYSKNINYANGIWVSAGSNDTLATSTDTIIWTLRTLSITPGTGGYKVLYGNNVHFVYYTSGTLPIGAVSTDGIVWTGAALLGSSNDYYTDIIFDGGVFIAAGTFNGAASILTSINGLTWTRRTSISLGNPLRSVVSDPNFILPTIISDSVEINISYNPSGSGGSGSRGGGGGGASYNSSYPNLLYSGGTGGDGYVRISWV